MLLPTRRSSHFMVERNIKSAILSAPACSHYRSNGAHGAYSLAGHGAETYRLIQSSMNLQGYSRLRGEVPRKPSKCRLMLFTSYAHAHPSNHVQVTINSSCFQGYGQSVPLLLQPSNHATVPNRVPTDEKSSHTPIAL